MNKDCTDYEEFMYKWSFIRFCADQNAGLQNEQKENKIHIFVDKSFPKDFFVYQISSLKEI